MQEHKEIVRTCRYRRLFDSVARLELEQKLEKCENTKQDTNRSAEMLWVCRVQSKSNHDVLCHHCLKSGPDTFMALAGRVVRYAGLTSHFHPGIQLPCPSSLARTATQAPDKTAITHRSGARRRNPERS
jgi:hypothetical protein